MRRWLIGGAALLVLAGCGEETTRTVTEGGATVTVGAVTETVVGTAELEASATAVDDATEDATSSEAADPTAVTIAKPKAGAKIVGPKVVVQGKGPDGVQVTVVNDGTDDFVTAMVKG